MKKHFSIILCLFSLMSIQCSARRATTAMPAASPPAPEIRALWVDGFHAGIRSPQEVSQLVADAKKGNINTLFIQVRRRGDALYTKSFEPPVEDAAYDPNFDGLAAILEAAHREGMEVHAWINAMPVWRNQPPPRDPRHVFNRHGLSQGENSWLTLSPKGEALFSVGYFLDPGHPQAAQYLLEVFLNIVKNYPVDGIHFDYIRYPETEERMPRGAPVGYNAVNLARFHRATGRTDTPMPGDEQWMAWRRQQVTQLVRRIYIEAKAVRPRIKISAATIAWGKPPLKETDFLEAAPGQRIYQDWHSWLKEGILDLAVPMNYARENDPTVRGWFNGWIQWEKQHKHGRQLAVGIGAYLNAAESNLAQVQRVRKPERGRIVDGVSFFSYASLNALPQPRPENPPPPGDRISYLTQGGGGATGAFAKPAEIPRMDWIEHPAQGWLAGVVGESVDQRSDGIAVRLKRAGWWPFRRESRTITDGNGYFGFTNLQPGKYVVRTGEAGKIYQRRAVEILAGKVMRIDLKKP